MSVKSVVSELLQDAWRAWALARHRGAFDDVRAFCLFVGYPRSGHSIYGAFVNAHRQAVIAHELQVPRLVAAGTTRDDLYARILARAAWFRARGNTSNYTYQVPNQWQGRFERLRVIGDKRGGSMVRAIQRDPALLDRIASIVGVPLRLIHVVRNPLDNIAAMALWHRLSLDDAITYYFEHFDITGPLVASGRSDLLTVYHEDLIREPEATLARVCAFLDLEADPAYLADCASIVADRPSYTRRRMPWSSVQVDQVRRQAGMHPFLARYTLDVDPADDGPWRAATRAGRQPKDDWWPRTVRRWFPAEVPPTLPGGPEPTRAIKSGDSPGASRP